MYRISMRTNRNKKEFIPQNMCCGKYFLIRNIAIKHRFRCKKQCVQTKIRYKGKITNNRCNIFLIFQFVWDFSVTDNRNIRRIETISIAYIYDTRALLLLLLIFTQQNSCLLGCKNAQVVISKKKKYEYQGKISKVTYEQKQEGKKWWTKCVVAQCIYIGKGGGRKKRKNLLIINGN